MEERVRGQRSSRRPGLIFVLLGMCGVAALFTAAGAWGAPLSGNVASPDCSRGVAPQDTCGPTWVAVAHPTVGAVSGVSGVSSNQVWAVAKAVGTTSSSILKWDGSNWTGVPYPSPSPSGSYTDLYAASAYAQDDAWVVGIDTGDLGLCDYGCFGAIRHWNGTSWTFLGGSPLPDALSSKPSSPNGANYLAENLYGVYAGASNQAWVVGYRTVFGNPGPTQGPIVLRCTAGVGCTSSNVFPNSSTAFRGVSGTSIDDVWIVGDAPATSYVEHWDGVSWTPFDHPNVDLRAVAALGTSDVWAVGQDGSSHSAIIHWDGSTWTSAVSPDIGVLRGVDGASGDDVWAVGDGGTLHWNGTDWSIASSPGTNLNSVSAVAPNDVWAVGGTSSSDAVTQRLYDEPSFSDVDPYNPFFRYVQCMACRGIISGYPDGTFKPNNSVTRGQLSKIVSNAVGYSDPPGNQIFEDVLPGSTYFDFVSRLVMHGLIGGYACGGPGEPCVPPDNLPYFRTNNTATRGQIAKIVSEAAGYTDPPGAQIFEDVLPGSTYYDFINRLVMHGIMSGYACSGPGEPCMPPDNRPYFRPNAVATRGQVSKIVGNTFFPGCSTIVKR